MLMGSDTSGGGPQGWATRMWPSCQRALSEKVAPHRRDRPREREKPRRAGLFEVRRRGLEPPPGYPGPGPHPDSGGVLSVQTALERHIPSAGEDDPDGEDDADVPKSVLTNPPQRARSRLGDPARPPRVSSIAAAIRCVRPARALHGKRVPPP